MKSLISLNSNHTAVRIQFEKRNVCLQNLYTVCNCLSSVPALCSPLQWQAIQVRWPAPAYELPSLSVSRPRPLVSLWCDSWWPTRWALSRRRRHLWQLQQQHHGWGATGFFLRRPEPQLDWTLFLSLSLVREELWAVYQWVFQARGNWPHIT